MSAPDARDWHMLDLDAPIVSQIDAAIRKFDAAHPDVIFVRHTFLRVDRSEPWLCIDGWLVPPDDQGHAPCRSLESYLDELVDRHARLVDALSKGTRIPNRRTMDELRDLHSKIRAIEAEIDAREQI